MSVAFIDGAFEVHKLRCEDGRRFIVYNASAIANPPGHVPDKWYFRPYPAPYPLDADAIGPFDSDAEAERAAREGAGVGGLNLESSRPRDRRTGLANSSPA
jgi:hypothetical protein